MIELPEDDPEILIRFLTFLYTGNYEDGEYPTQDEPSFEATMDPDEVQRELERAPGVLTCGLDGEGHDPRVRSQILAMVNGNDDKIDANYEPSPPNTEPEEEYLYLSNSEEGEEDEEDEEGDEEGDEEVDGEGGGEGGGEAEGEADGEVEGEGDAEADEEEDEDDDDYVESHAISLLISLRVYVMADKFDVPALKLLARHRFYYTAREIFQTYSGFPAVVDELYETTAPTDYIMREIPCRLIAASYASNRSDTTVFEPLMCKHGDLAVGVLKYSQMYWLNPSCRGCVAKALEEGTIWV